MAKIAEGSMHLSLNAKLLNAQLQAAKERTARETRDMVDAINGTGKYKPKKAKLAPTWIEELKDRWKNMSQLSKGLAIGGLVAGVVAAVAAAIAKAVDLTVKGFSWLATKALDLKEKILAGTLVLPAQLSKGVAVTTNALARVSTAWDKFSARLVTAFAPTFDMLADVAVRALQMIAPSFEWLGQQVNEVLSISLTLGNAFTSMFAGVLNLVPTVARVLGRLADVQESLTFSLKVFSGIAGYTWDAQRVAVGGLVFALGHLVKAIGSLVEGFQSLGKLANLIPDQFKPSWLTGWSTAVQSLRSSTTAVGDGLIAFGRSEMNSFGSTVTALNGMIDNFFNAAKQRREQALKNAKELTAKLEYKPVAAAEFGSKELASIKARFTTEGLVKNIAKDQLKAQQEANRHLGEISKSIKNINPAVFSIF